MCDFRCYCYFIFLYNRSTQKNNNFNDDNGIFLFSILSSVLCRTIVCIIRYLLKQKRTLSPPFYRSYQIQKKRKKNCNDSTWLSENWSLCTCPKREELGVGRIFINYWHNGIIWTLNFPFWNWRCCIYATNTWLHRRDIYHSYCITIIWWFSLHRWLAWLLTRMFALKFFLHCVFAA